MQIPSKEFENAVEKISKLPTIGKRTALRIVLYILSKEKNFASSLSESIYKLKTDIVFCKTCHNISNKNGCKFCSNPNRKNGELCIVEKITDVFALESTGIYKGKYHIIGGLISPLEGVTSDMLKISDIFSRIEQENINEVILALNTTMEGETTSLYIKDLIKNRCKKITTLSRGIATGDELQYVDELTLGNSLINRILL